MTLAFVKKFFTYPVVLIIFGMMVFGFFCMGTGTHISDANSHGNQLSLQNSQSCCNGTGIVSHVSTWKNKFLVMPYRENTFLSFLMFLSILSFAFYKISSYKTLKNTTLLSGRLYKKEHSDWSIFDNLKLAFAQGLLEPKIY